jgi:elongator complex protein 1
VRFGLEACASERGTAAVIDGRRLLLTPLRLALVPPPLAAAELRAPAPACCVALRSHGAAEVCA